MLSRMTDLTIPTMASPRAPDPVIEVTHTVTKPVQLSHDEAGHLPANAEKTAYLQLTEQSATPSQMGAEMKVASAPKTPRTPRFPPASPSSLSHLKPGNSTSQLIDEWFTALQGSTGQSSQRVRNDIVRRGNVLLPPNIDHRYHQPVTPTRRPTKAMIMSPASTPKINFLADNPDDWKTPEEWNRVEFGATQDTTPVSAEVPAQEDGIPNMAAAYSEGPHARDPSGPQADNSPQDGDGFLDIQAGTSQELGHPARL